MFDIGDKVWFKISDGVHIGEVRSKQRNIYNVVGKGIKYNMTYKLKEKEMHPATPQAECLAMEHYLKCLAHQKNVKPTENLPKIAKARVMMKLKWTQCPCGGEGRGCISDKCIQEIAKNGQCHCNCFKRK